MPSGLGIHTILIRIFLRLSVSKSHEAPWGYSNFAYELSRRPCSVFPHITMEHINAKTTKWNGRKFFATRIGASGFRPPSAEAVFWVGPKHDIFFANIRSKKWRFRCRFVLWKFLPNSPNLNAMEISYLENIAWSYFETFIRCPNSF